MSSDHHHGSPSAIDGARLVRDPECRTAWTLFVDDWAQSYVDRSDACRLRWDCVRRIAAVIDSCAASGAPIRALHLGGGALTLPRYVASTRPGSAQVVIEHNAELVELVRRVLRVPEDEVMNIRVADARSELEAAPAQRYDLVVADVFDKRQQVSARYTSVEFFEHVARVLREGGIYAANIADSPALEFTRAYVAGLRSVFGSVGLLADAPMLAGRRYGNVVLAAAHAPLPFTELARLNTAPPGPARVLSGGDLDRFVGDALPVTDRTATPSPLPPAPYESSPARPDGAPPKPS